MPSRVFLDGFFYIFATHSYRIMEEFSQLALFELPEPEEYKHTFRHRTLAQETGVTVVSRSDRIAARNRVLTARYYYWTELQRRRFDDVLRILADREFFVEERTISNALLAQDEFYRELCYTKATRKQLRKMFPGFDWS